MIYFELNDDNFIHILMLTTNHRASKEVVRGQMIDAGWKQIDRKRAEFILKQEQSPALPHEETYGNYILDAP